MIKIESSAQAFGYGPASKLVTFLKNLGIDSPGFAESTFRGSDVAFTYVDQNRHYFNNIECGSTPDPDCDLVVSAMEPNLIFWAVAHHKKTIYIDSLYWFWKWNPGDYEYLNGLVTQIRNCESYSEIVNLTENLDHHVQQYLAHSLATQSLVQIFPGTLESNDHDPFRANLEVTRIGYLIDSSFKKENLARTKILISLSGLISPLNDLSAAISYYEFILKLFGDTLNDLPEDIEVILTTNPILTNKLSSSHQRIKINSLDHDQFLRELNESIVVIAPTGITTILESLVYDTPLIFLPEQHDGHFENYHRLTQSNIDTTAFPEMLFNTRIQRTLDSNPDQELKQIQELIIQSNFDVGSQLVESMKATFTRALISALNPIEREKMLKAQQNSVLKDDYVLNPGRTSQLVTDVITGKYKRNH